MKQSLLIIACAVLFLGACSQTTSATSTDNSAAADANGAADTPNAVDTLDPAAAQKATFTQLVAAEDNDFADITDKNSRKAVGADAMYNATIGFSKPYPCTIGKVHDSAPAFAYCIVGSNASQTEADANFDAAKQLVTSSDASLVSVTPTGTKLATDINTAQFQNDNHGVYVIETKQNNRFVVKFTFAKPAVLK